MSNEEDTCDCEIDESQKVNQMKKKMTKEDKISYLMKQSIYDKSIEIPKKLDKDKRGEKRIAEKGIDEKRILSKCSPILPFKLEDMNVEKVLVEYRIAKPKSIVKENISKNEKKSIKKIKEASSGMSDCDAFRLAGFQQDWTKEKVEGMLKSDDGRMLLERVDREFKKLTGKKIIAESDILKCYPNYLNKAKNIQLSIKID